MATLPAIAALDALPRDHQTTILDLLFEPSPTLHALALPLLTDTYPDYATLIDAVGAALQALEGRDAAALDAILGAHPRLGAAKVDSAQSRAEQAQLQDHAAELAELNAEYERRFPGLRYLVFVNGRGRPEIMADMRRRTERGDLGMERAEARQAMCDIAKDRARKLQAGD